MKKIFMLAACSSFSLLSADSYYQYPNGQPNQPAGGYNFQNTQQGNQYQNGPSNQPRGEYNAPNTQPGSNYGIQPNYQGQQQQNLQGQQQPYGYNDKSFYQISHTADTSNDETQTGERSDRFDERSRSDERPDEQRDRNERRLAQANSVPDDPEISKSVRDVLYGWFSSGNQNISFEVNEGTVTLSGVVDSREEKDKIENNIRKIKGIKQVKSNITVSEPKKVAYYQPQRMTNLSVSDDQKTVKDYAALESDKKLNAQIRKKLDSQSFNDVVIITANGVVSLAGSVNNLKDFQVALKDIEKIDGVKKVNNKVTEKK